MRTITVVFRKQLLETPKNKAILIQFVMFPLLVVNFLLAVLLFAAAYRKKGLS